MNVIFLDIDGVLQANDTDWFSMTALKLLRELVRHTDAKIVLSSTWRLLASTRQIVNDRLSLVGLEVFELTPRSVGGGAGNRASEIAEWLDAAEERRLDVANWVVLDDRDVRALDEQRFQNHTVLINPFTGLRFCDLVAALRVFGRDEADLAMLKSPSTGDLQALMDMQLQLGLGGGGAHEPVSPRHSSELIPI